MFKPLIGIYILISISYLNIKADGSFDSGLIEQNDTFTVWDNSTEIKFYSEKNSSNKSELTKLTKFVFGELNIGEIPNLGDLHDLNKDEVNEIQSTVEIKSVTEDNKIEELPGLNHIVDKANETELNEENIPENTTSLNIISQENNETNNTVSEPQNVIIDLDLTLLNQTDVKLDSILLTLMDSTTVSVSNDKNFSESSETNSQIKLRPNYLINVQFEPNVETLTIFNGKPLKLNCSSFSEPETNLHLILFKETEFITESNQSQITYEVNHAQASNQGKYYCFSFNKDFSAYNFSVIQVFVQGSIFELDFMPSIQKATEGESLEIKCETILTDSESKIYLYKNNKFLSSSINSSLIKLNGISKLDEGTYMCHGLNEDRSNQKFRFFDLFVETKTEITGFVMDNITLSCSLKNKYNSIDWKKIDQKWNSTGYVVDGDFYIPILRQDDEGEYECYYNETIYERIKLRVKNQSDPIYYISSSINEQTIKIKIGQTVQQICMATTNGSNIRLYWYNSKNEQIKKSDRVSINTIVTSLYPSSSISILTIKDFKEEDYGSYECRQQVLEKIESIQFHINPDLSLPMHISEEAKITHLKLGSSFQFSCHVNVSNEQVKMILYKDDEIIDSSKHNQIKHEILNAKRNSAGKYTCKAYFINNSTETFESKSLTIKIDTENDLYVGKSSNLTLSCGIASYGIIPKLMKLNGKLNEKNNILDGKLKINNFDQSDAGEYACVLENEQIEKFELTFLDIKNFNIPINFKTNKIAKKAGASIDQVCLVDLARDFEPNDVTVQWFKPNGELIEENLKYKIQTLNTRGYESSPVIISNLNIKFIDNKDFGNYECRVSLGYLINTQEFELINSFATSETTPVPSLSSSLIDLAEGDDISINCNADNYTDIIWYLNNKNAEKFKNVKVNGTILTINGATNDLNGYITCRIVKDLITSQDSAQIIINSRQVKSLKIESDQNITDKKISINRGGLLILDCKLEANYKSFVVVWSKLNDTFNNGTKFENNRLTIPNVQFEHGGRYECRVDSTNITDYVDVFVEESTSIDSTTIATSTATRLEIIESLVVTSDSEIIAEIGSNIDVYCLSDNVDEDVYKYVKWVKSVASVEQPNVKRDKNLISFRNINEQNEGQFNCFHKSGNKKGSITLTVIIERKSKLPTAKILIMSQMKFKCNTDGYPRPDFKWIFNNTEIDQNNEIFNLNKTVLTLKNFTKDVVGELVCRAIGVDGVIAEDKKLISLQINSILVVDIEPKYLEAKVGEEAIFKCIIKEGVLSNIQADIIWNKNNGTILNRNFNIDEEDELSFEIKSVHESGVYSCQAIDFFNKIKSNIAYATLNVTDEVDCKLNVNISSNHKIDYNNRILTVKERDNLTLRCDVCSNRYKTNLHWEIFKTTKPTHEINLRDGNQLVFNNVQKSNAGKYECVVVNALTNLTLFSEEVEIVVEDYAPIIIDLEHKNESDKSFLSCAILQGYPNANITWTRNGELLTDYYIEEIVNEQSELYLVKNSSNYYGVYRCIASNIYDTVYLELTIEDESIEKATTDEAELKTDEITKVYGNRTNETIILETSTFSTITDTSFISTTPTTANTTKTPTTTSTASATDDSSTTSTTTDTSTTTTSKLKVISVSASGKYELEAGSNVEFVCKSFNKLNQSYSIFEWRVKFKKHEETLFETENDVLKFNNLDLSNEGQYECKITNKLTNKAEVIQISLIVKRKPEPPTARLPTRIINFAIGQRGTIICFTNGYPKPKVNWFFNGTSVNLYNKFYSLGNILYLKDASLDLEGYITCQAVSENNLIAQDTGYISVGGEKSISVELKVNKNNVTFDDNVKFECIVKGKHDFKDIKYTWLKNNIPISEKQEINTLELNINSSEEAGVYSCQAFDSKEIFKSNKASVNLQFYEIIKLKAAIESDLKIQDKTLNLKESEDITLNCTTNLKDQAITIEWFKLDDLNTSNISIPTNGSQLEIKNIQFEQSGNYTCIAKTEQEETSSDFISLNVHNYEPIKLKLEFTNDLEYNILDCLVLSGNPMPILNWIRTDNQPIENAEFQLHPFGVIQLKLNKNYSSSYGAFECVAKNVFETVAEQTNLINETNLEIEEESTSTTQTTSTISQKDVTIPETTKSISSTQTETIKKKIFYPRVTNKTKTVVKKITVNKDMKLILDTGANVDLICNLFEENEKTSSIQWFRNNQKLFPKSFLKKREVLKIRDFEQADSGEYECFGYTTNQTKNIIITLKGKDNKLTAKLKKNYFEFKTGDKSIITCNTYPHFNSNELKEIVWSINGILSTEFDNIKTYGNELYILNATSSLHGILSCKAIGKNSEIAEDTGVIRMNQGKVLFVDIYPKILNIKIGEKAEIDCIIDNLNQLNLSDHQNIEFEWKKNNSKLINSSNIEEISDGKLIINVKSQSDAGVYSCQAYDKEDNTRSNVENAVLIVNIKKEDINLEIKSNKNIKNKNMILKSGDDVSLNCLIKSNDELTTVDWIKLDDNLDPDYHFKSDNGSQLQIKNIQPKHSGKYSCLVRSDDINHESVSDYVTIAVHDYEPLNITIEKFQNDETINLECSSFAGSPSPKLEWVRSDGKKIENEIKEYLSYGISELVLEKSDENIYTSYECIAKNVFEQTVKKINLVKKPIFRELVSLSYQVRINQSSIILDYGQSYDIKCHLEGFSNPKIEWYLNNKPLDSLVDSSIFKIERNTFHILSATEDLRGLLTCQVSEDSISKSDSVELIVKEKTSDIYVEIEPKNIETYERETVIFKCVIRREHSFFKKQNLVYTWYKHDRSEPDPLKYQHSNELAVRDLKPSDSGYYSCEIENVSNLASAKLIVLPRLTNDYEFLEEEDSEIECSLESNQNYTIIWSKINDELDLIRHRPNGKKLKIIRTRITDRGDYECKLLNKNLNVLDKEYIRVEVLPRKAPVLKISPSQDEINEYARFLSINCIVLEGKPRPIVEWRRKDGKRFSNRVTVSNGVLNIKDAQINDHGVYECVARNSVGQSIVEISVKPLKRF